MNFYETCCFEVALEWAAALAERDRPRTARGVRR